MSNQDQLQKLSTRDEARIQLALSRGARASIITNATLYSVVLKPGATGTLAPNEFTSWDALYAACSGVAGGVRVLIDDSVDSPVHITAGSYAIDNWRFVGCASYNDVRATSAMEIDDGVTFAINNSRLQLFFDWLDITSPAATDLVTAGDDVEVNVFLTGTRLAMTAAGAFVNVKTTAPGGFAIFDLFDFSELGDGTHAVIKAAATFATIDALGGSHVRAACLSGGGIISYDASSENDVAAGGGITLILEDQAPRVGYTPAVDANWQPAPADVGDALDQLAAPNTATTVSHATSVGATVINSGNPAAITKKRSGQVTVDGSLAVTASLSCVVTWVLLKDGAAFGPEVSQNCSEGAVVTASVNYVSTIDTTTHDFDIQATASSGTLTCLANNGSVRVVEQ